MCCDACEKVIVMFPDVTDASVGLTDVRTTFLGLEHFSSLAVFRGSDSALISSKIFYIYTYAFSRRFYPKRLTLHSGYTFYCQYVCSLGIEPTTFCTANAILYH